MVENVENEHKILALEPSGISNGSYGGVFDIGDGLLVLSALVLSFSLDLAEIYLGLRLKRSPSLIKGLVLGAFLVVIFTMKSSNVIPFIYFRF